MDLPETNLMLVSQFWTVLGGSAVVPFGFVVFTVVAMHWTALLAPRYLSEAKEALCTLLVAAPWALAATAVIACIWGVQVDLDRAGGDFRAAAQDTYGVSVTNDDAKDVMERVATDKSSKEFNVDGYAREVYAAVAPSGKVTIRDAKTDKELPTTAKKG